MSVQNATVRIAPAREVLNSLFGPWGYQANGTAFFDCTSSTVAMNITLVSWDGTKLTMAGTFNSPCAGMFTAFSFDLLESSNNFGGFCSISGMNIGVMANRTYTVYLVETLSSPTTAPIQVS